MTLYDMFSNVFKGYLMLNIKLNTHKISIKTNSQNIHPVKYSRFKVYCMFGFYYLNYVDNYCEYIMKNE